MARRISDEPLATTLTADDVFLGNDGAVTKQFPASLLPGFSAGTFNIKDYGAVVDGTTVDSVAIQAAIAAANAAGGGEVLFPAGTTVTNVAISLSGVSKVTLRGVHRSASILKQASAANITTGVINATTAGSNLVIRDLGVDGNRAGQTVGLTTGIRFPSSTSTRVRITGCHVFNCGARGMSITGTEFEIDHNLATGCADAGIGLNEGADRAKIHHNSLNLNEGDGIYIGSRDNEASFNLCWDNRDTGINFGGPNDPTGYARIIGNECWLNDNSGLNTGGGDRTIISGNTCYANGRKVDTPRSNAGIRVRDTTGTDPESGLNFAANHIIVTSNHCYDDTTTYPLASGALGQLYGVEVVDATSQATTDDPDQIIIVGNDLLGNLTGGVAYVNAAPTQVRLIGNLGVGDDGQAMVGGDLTGTVENAEIAAGAVGLAELASAAKPAVNVKDPAYGAVGDARFVTDGVIGAGTLSTLTSATAVFTAGDVGKAIDISGAGTASAQFSTTISAYTNATTVTLAAPAAQATTAARAQFGTNDSAAIQAAITAALAVGGPRAVYLPPGNYKTVAALTINGSLAFRGAGRGVTTITPTTPVVNAECIDVTAPDGSTVELEDFTIQGPTGMPILETPPGIGINYALDNTYASRFTVRRVTVNGTYFIAINRQGGGLVELDDCWLEGIQVGAGVYESLNAVDKMLLIARGCTFTNPNGDMTNQGSVGIYIHPHVPYIVTGCRFLTLGRYGIYENGTPNSVRRPAVVTGCEFVDTAVIKTESRGRTTVTGCTMKGALNSLGSVLYGNETMFAGCTFENVGPASVFRRALFKSCTFINSGLLLEDAASAYADVTGCRFRMDAVTSQFAGQFVSAVGSVAASYSFVSDCDFEDVSTTGSTGAALDLFGTLHDARVVNCRFRGVRNTTGLAVVFHRGTRLLLEGCEFDNTAQGTTAAVGVQAAGALEGTGNVFRGTAKIGTFDGTAQQRLVRRPGVNPTTVASAATIDTNVTAWLNYDTHVVSGSAAIATLSNPWVAVGPVRLVVAAGATWSTASSGNITPLSTAARTAGSVVTLLWEPTAGKWLETGTAGGSSDPTMGGDLSGLASAAQLGAGVVGATEVAAAIKDATAGTASLRTLGTGAAQAAAGDHAHAASAVTFTPTGTVAATDAQAAIAELDSELAARVTGTAVGGDLSGTVNNALLTGVLGYASGGWYVPDNAGATGTTAAFAMTASRLYLARFDVGKAASFDRIGIEVSTAGSAGCVIRLGIYNAASGLPTTVLLDAGTVAADSTGAKEITISQALPRGVYFLAAAMQVASGAFTRVKEEHVPGLFHFSILSPTNQVAGFFQASVSGALPSYTNGLSGNINQVAKVYVRAA